MKHVLVCGSRYLTYADHYPAMEIALDAIHNEHKIVTIINGGMMGADALSSYWAYQRKVDTKCEGALWGTLGQMAGPARNWEMIKLLPKLASRHGTGALVVAFPLQGRTNKGTNNCINQARNEGFRVHQVEMLTK